VHQWPSKTHPYLIWLFSFLKQDFSNLTLMVFDRSAKQYGYELLGKEKTDAVLDKAIYRQAYSLNPFRHLKTILTGLVHLKQSIAIIKECKQNGLTVPQVYGQFLYYHQLLGKHFELVHINALQTAYHIKAKAWFGNAKVLVSSRGQDFDFSPNKFDAALLRTDHVHVLGNHLQNKVLSKGFAADKITIIAPAYIPDNNINAVPKTISKRKVHVATAARLTWTKGYRYAIHAIHQLAKQNIDIHYHIYGEGEQNDELVYLIKMLNLSGHITLHGWLNETDLKKKLVQYDIYLLLSIEEGFNNSVVMAQSLGLPCIVSQAGGLPENVIHNKTGIVVSSYNSAEASDAIRNLINDPDQYSSMSKNAIERVNDLSIDKQVKAYSDLYLKILSS
jgi:glycosyltransferase involved in cell wall biosynthesis